MRESARPKILQLRFLVGFLGEAQQFAWWPTSFFGPSSKAFLEPVFTRTTRLAQYHGVLEASRRLHDEHLNVGCYHLFRLPEEVEQDLHGMVLSTAGEEIATESTMSRDAALQALRALATTGVAGTGPTAVGHIDDVDSPAVLGAIAAVYHSAFASDGRAFPYLKG